MWPLGQPCALAACVVRRALEIVACTGAVMGCAAAPHASQSLAQRIDAPDLVPAVCDVLVRIDVARLRETLGDAFDRACARVLPDPNDALLLGALLKGDVAWVAFRSSAPEDRVVILEGRFYGFELQPPFRRRDAAIGASSVFHYDRVEKRPGEMVHIDDVDDRLLAFATFDAKSWTTLRAAPNSAVRLDPPAEGVLSFDSRVAELSPEHRVRFASLAKVLAGVDRVRGLVSVTSAGLRLESSIVARDTEAAAQVRAFLLALRDDAEKNALAPLRAAQVQLLGTTLRVDVLAPRSVLVDAVGR
jgi:hypothetical protein